MSHICDFISPLCAEYEVQPLSYRLNIEMFAHLLSLHLTQLQSSSRLFWLTSAEVYNLSFSFFSVFGRM